jgi:hypothetical protein
VWEELASLLEHMPRLCVRELVRVLRSPLQWLRLYRRWRKAQGLHTRYNLLRAAGLETRVVIEQMKRVCGVYWAAGAELVSISEELDRLEHKVHEVLGTERELPDWPDLPLLLGDDPDTLLAQLTECHLPEMEEQAAYLLDHSGPLSKWWGNGLPHQKDISQWLKELVEPLATIPIGEVMRYRYPDPQAVAHWMDELAAQASPLWRWDPAALSEAERAHVGGATVILSALDGSVPWTEDDKSGWRCLPLARGDRLAVVALRWGIPCLKRDA